MNGIVSLNDARSRILQDSTLSEWDKVKALQALQQASNDNPGTAPIVSVGDIVRGAIGAGIGYGAANIFGRFMGADDDTLSKLRLAGIGLGTMLNTGMIKAAEERDARNAFRMGFLKAARDLGWFEKKAAVMPIAIPLTPGAVLEPVRAGYNLYSNTTGAMGAGAAALDSANSTDEDLVRMELEAQELERQADLLEALRANKQLSEVVKRRRA